MACLQLLWAEVMAWEARKETSTPINGQTGGQQQHSHGNGHGNGHRHGEEHSDDEQTQSEDSIQHRSKPHADVGGHIVLIKIHVPLKLYCDMIARLIQ